MLENGSATAHGRLSLAYRAYAAHGLLKCRSVLLKGLD